MRILIISNKINAIVKLLCKLTQRHMKLTYVEREVRGVLNIFE